jgi:hypothetical protein
MSFPLRCHSRAGGNPEDFVRGTKYTPPSYRKAKTLQVAEPQIPQDDTDYFLTGFTGQTGFFATEGTENTEAVLAGLRPLRISLLGFAQNKFLCQPEKSSPCVLTSAQNRRRNRFCL